jgi:hypothetical protein
MSTVLAIVTLIGDNQKAIKNANQVFPNSAVITTPTPSNSTLPLGNEQFDHLYIDEDWSGLENDSNFLSECARVLKKNGTIMINSMRSLDMPLMIAGFMNTKSDRNVVTAQKPNFSFGTAVSLSTKQQTIIPAKSESKKIVLNLNDDDMDEDLVGDEDLLEEDDLKAPSTTEFDCGTGKTKKACKNCTCGLADIEIKNEQQEREERKKVMLDLNGVDTEIKSGCGSCFKGDAFRCGTCPYLGTPAFKPGEKVLKLNLDSDL